MLVHRARCLWTLAAVVSAAACGSGDAAKSRRVDSTSTRGALDSGAVAVEAKAPLRATDAGTVARVEGTFQSASAALGKYGHTIMVGDSGIVWWLTPDDWNWDNQVECRVGSSPGKAEIVEPLTCLNDDQLPQLRKAASQWSYDATTDSWAVSVAGKSVRFNRKANTVPGTQRLACDVADAEMAIVSAARRQLPFPKITLTQGNWTPTGTCAWAVRGALKMVDPTQVAGSWTFTAEVSRRSTGQYDVQKLRVTGKQP